MGKTKYVIDNEVKEVARQLIKENNIFFIDIEKVVFVKIDKDIKSGDVLGRCALISDRNYFLHGKRFFIEFPPAFYELDKVNQRRVIHHELLHIHPDGDKLRDHDIQEFIEIMKAYGIEYVQLLESIKENLLKKSKEKKEKKDGEQKA